MNPQTMSDQFGKNMDPELLEHMRDEQIAQLYELMKATKEQKDSDKQCDNWFYYSSAKHGIANSIKHINKDSIRNISFFQSI